MARMTAGVWRDRGETEQARELRLLRAVADAARAVANVDEWVKECSSVWGRCAAALDALDGGERDGTTTPSS